MLICKLPVYVDEKIRYNFSFFFCDMCGALKSRWMEAIPEQIRQASDGRLSSSGKCPAQLDWRLYYSNETCIV